MTSPTDVVQKEVDDLRVLLDSLKEERALSERGAIRQRARLAQSMMLYVADQADTQHPTWKELSHLTHKILVETADVERFQRQGLWG
jgi:hypothetical protein